MAGASKGFSKSWANVCRSLYASYSLSLPLLKELVLLSGDASMEGMARLLAVRRMLGGVLFSSIFSWLYVSCDALAYLPLLLVFVEAFARPESHWEAMCGPLYL